MNPESRGPIPGASVVLRPVSHLSSTSPPCQGGTCPGRLHGSDAVNVLYPRWGKSMRRRTPVRWRPQATESFPSPYDFIRITGGSPEPLLTASSLSNTYLGNCFDRISAEMTLT